MRVLITTAGSHGDVHPFLGVASALAARGHEVLFVANEYYRSVVTRENIRFQPIGEAFDLRTLSTMPDIMHHWRGPDVVVRRLMLPHMRATMAMLPGLLRRERIDLVLHHHICLSVPWVCERLGVPCATGVLAPMMWMSPGDPILVNPMMSTFAPPWFSRLTGAIIPPVIRLRIDPIINGFRRTLGMKDGRDFFVGQARSGAAVLGLWSPVMRGALATDPPGAVITGVPWHDQAADQAHPPADIERFLGEGEAPILFSLGTAAVHVAGPFYHAAAEACRVLGKRGMLLVGRAPEVAPASLPAGVKVFGYAPFSTVMPRVLCSVHHGGIGTTSQGLRAGRPTVIVPHAHDQFDNAARVKRLRVSQTVPASEFSVETLVAAIRRVVDDPRCVQSAREVGERMRNEDGGPVAAKALEDAMRTTRTVPRSSALR
jgi:UDP:flavonoid glycosyltransferase YjiC (YdhE family)